MELSLFDVYPELTGRIEGLCGGVPWCITGVSALVHDGAALYFELTKPKHWTRRADGTVIVGIGGIGGSLEPQETILGCLCREVEEELNAGVIVGSANETYLVYEQKVADSLALERRAYPRPAFFTISQNLYRHHIHPEYPILAIVTFVAQLRAEPTLDDLFGLLAIPREGLPTVLCPEEIAIEQVRGIEGVRVLTQEPLPERVILSPVWTARSLQLLLRDGYSPDTEGVQR